MMTDNEHKEVAKAKGEEDGAKDGAKCDDEGNDSGFPMMTSSGSTAYTSQDPESQRNERRVEC